MRYTDIPEDARKYHYYRGFRSAVIVLSPFIIALVWACETAITALGF